MEGDDPEEAAPAEPREGEEDAEDAKEERLSRSPEVIRAVQKIHENMGHPSQQSLFRTLKFGKARKRYLKAALRLKCGGCGEKP